MTTQKQVRRAFWETFPQLKPYYRATWRQNKYPCDIRMAFCDYVENLRIDRVISAQLAGRVTL